MLILTRSRAATVLVAGTSFVTLGLTGCSSSSPKNSSPAAAGSSASAAAHGTGVNAPASTASGSGSASVDVCSLLTAAQATSLTGITYTSATSSSGGKQCVYATTAAPTPMTIAVMPNAGSASAWTDELATLQQGGGEKPIPISGLGDRAANVIDALGVQSGGWIIEIDGGDSASSGGSFTKSIACAKKIIEGLH